MKFGGQISKFIMKTYNSEERNLERRRMKVQEKEWFEFGSKSHNLKINKTFDTSS